MTIYGWAIKCVDGERNLKEKKKRKLRGRRGREGGREEGKRETNSYI